MDTVTARTGYVRELVDRHLERLLERQLGRLAFLDDEDAGLVREHLVAFVLGGGKRLRPEFVYWGYRAGGGERPEEVLPAACAVELVHAAALLLDDIMDEAGARRGRPPAHVALAGLHRAKGMRGDPERFGESVATLLALLALTWADAAILETGPHLPAALDHLTRLRVEAIGGQYLDLTRTFAASPASREPGIAASPASREPGIAASPGIREAGTAASPGIRPSDTAPPGARAAEPLPPDARPSGAGGTGAVPFGSGVPADLPSPGARAGEETGEPGERAAGEAATGTAAGQERAGGRDAGREGGGTADAEQARLISLYKSGKYTVERPLLLGHAVAGGSAPTRRLLRAYALPLGEAFQLRDDINGVFGDPAATGKPAGADLIQGKATYLLAEARRRTGGAPALDAITGPEGVAEARRLIVECGALDAAERRIADLVAEAIAALDHPPGLPPDARRALIGLATATTRPPGAPAAQADSTAPGSATPVQGGGEATEPSTEAVPDTGTDAPPGPAGGAAPGAGLDGSSGPAGGAAPGAGLDGSSGPAEGVAPGASLHAPPAPAAVAGPAVEAGLPGGTRPPAADGGSDSGGGGEAGVERSRAWSEGRAR